MTHQRHNSRNLVLLRLVVALGLAILSMPFFSSSASGIAASTTITVQVGGDRSGTGGAAVTGLPGVTLQLYSDNGGTIDAAVPDAWGTCLSDAAGACTFTVPDTENGKSFWVKQTGVPAGWFMNPVLRTGTGHGTSNVQAAYEFRTPALSGAPLTGADFMPAQTNGIWQNSRKNPTLPPHCGLDVALVLDLSQSVAPSLGDLKGAADTFADALVGTQSRMAVFSFASAAPAAGGANLPTLKPLTTQAQADAFKAQYAGWTAGTATNWDQGFYAVAPDPGEHYDLVVVITDGNPTLFAAGGDGSNTTIANVDYGIFSANKLKDTTGARFVAVGVGTAVNEATFSGLNLRAISGPTKYDGTNSMTADFYQESTFTAAGQALKDLALGSCKGSVNLIKHLVPRTNTGNDITGATMAGAGWEFNASTTDTGVTIDPPATATTGDDSSVTFDTNIPGGVASADITIKETQHTDHELVRVICHDLGSQVEFEPAISGGASAEPSFVTPVKSATGVVCDVYNRPAPPPPPVTTFVVKKVDFETGAALAGATFELWLDRGTIGAKDGQDLSLGAQVTGADGKARWGDLLKDTYLIEETARPAGYDWPAVTLRAFTIDDGNFDRDWEADPFVFEDPSIGNLAIVSKQQYEKDANGAWVLSDGVTDFGKQVKYVVKVSATGTKLFHNVAVTDYLPGYNPEDTHVFGSGSTMKATLVPGTAKCTGSLDCTVSVGANHLVTWTAGTVKNASGTVEMVVTFPAVPNPTPYNADGVFKASLWNVGYLDYDTAVATTPGSRAVATVHTHKKSNEVVIVASISKPPPIIHPCRVRCLPNTGSAPYLVQLGALGGLALAAGTAMLVRGRRRGEAAE